LVFGPQCAIPRGRANGTSFSSTELSFGEQAQLAHKRLVDFVNEVIILPSKGSNGSAHAAPIKSQLTWIAWDCSVKDLGGVEGAVKLLQDGFAEYLEHVKDKKRIERAWSRFGYLDVWNSAVPGTF
jgi:hypothetical protein